MTKPIEGVSERILSCATEEFLEKGYSDASLRTIAAKAGTTTGSIYSRFKDKEGLFAAIVGPVAEYMMNLFVKTQEEFHAVEPERQPKDVGRILRTFKIKKNVEVTDNGKIII